MAYINDTQLGALVTLITGKLNELNLAAAAAFRGGLAIADTPTGNGFWLPTESGTYTNAGSIVVDLTDGLTFLAYDGTTWTDVVVPVTIFVPENTFDETNEVDSATMFATKNEINAGDYTYGRNLFNVNSPDIINNFYLNNVGTEIANANADITPYIRLKPNTDYNYRGAKGTGLFGALYDKDKVWTRNTGSGETGSFTTTATEVYFRASIGNALNHTSGTANDEGLFQIEEGTISTLLEKYNVKRNLLNQTYGWWNQLPEDAEIILINTGQSNSVGAVNNNSGGSELSERVETDVVKVWNNGTLTWDNQDINAGGTHGYNIRFKDYAKKFNRPFKVINGGVTSTDIDYHISGLGYTNLWAQVQNAINDVLANGKRPYVYMLFVQGEKDSNSTASANAYAAKEITWMELWRTNLGEKLPIIMGGINEYGAGEADDIIVNNAKRRHYADGLITEFYEVLDLPTTDFLHRNYDGVVEEAGIIFSKFDNIGAGHEITNELPYTF